MTTHAEDIQANLSAVQARIVAACTRAGRAPEVVTLVAVSKQKPLAFIQQAQAAGVAHFGENRLAEAQAKIPALDAHWHMIGHVQSRKAQEVVKAGFHLVHSLDSVKLARRYARFAADAGQTLPVLLEINVSGEAAKHGWRADARETLWQDVAEVLALPHLAVRGLMTMAPWGIDPEATRPIFRGLAQLREALAADFPQTDWRELSMGMTDDFEIAIEEGATLVRIGRAIFGERA